MVKKSEEVGIASKHLNGTQSAGCRTDKSGRKGMRVGGRQGKAGGKARKAAEVQDARGLGRDGRAWKRVDGWQGVSRD